MRLAHFDTGAVNPRAFVNDMKAASCMSLTVQLVDLPKFLADYFLASVGRLLTSVIIGRFNNVTPVITSLTVVWLLLLLLLLSNTGLVMSFCLQISLHCHLRNYLPLRRRQLSVGRLVPHKQHAGTRGRAPRDERLGEKGLNPVRTHVYWPRCIHFALGNLLPLASAVLDKLLNVFRRKSNKNVPEEGPLRLVAARPLVRHVLPEVWEKQCLIPDPLNAHFRPNLYKSKAGYKIQHQYGWQDAKN